MTHKIYTLACPIEGVVFYIGQTVQTLNDRLNNHLLNAKEGKTATHLRINKIVEAGGRPHIEILEALDETTYKERREFFENYWILQFKSWGFRLTNERVVSVNIKAYKKAHHNYIIEWLIEHDLILIAPLEAKAGIPAGSLFKAIRGRRPLPEKYNSALIAELIDYGFE